MQHGLNLPLAVIYRLKTPTLSIILQHANPKNTIQDPLMSKIIQPVPLPFAYCAPGPLAPASPQISWNISTCSDKDL